MRTVEWTKFQAYSCLFLCTAPGKCVLKKCLWNEAMANSFSGIDQSVQLLSSVWVFANSWIVACQASLSITNSQSLLKLMSIESVMPSNHLILCRPLLILPSIFPSIRVFSNESVLHIWYRSLHIKNKSLISRGKDLGSPRFVSAQGPGPPGISLLLFFCLAWSRFDVGLDHHLPSRYGSAVIMLCHGRILYDNHLRVGWKVSPTWV